MKVLSLWQPWATLVAIGVKRIETRSWRTNYRGPLAIHAAGKWNVELARLCLTDPFWSVLKAVCDQPVYYRSGNALPLGAIVAVGRLEDCWRVERIAAADANRTPELDASCAATLRHWGHSEAVIADALRPMLSDQERAFGDYSAGRFGWFLRDMKALERPIPMKGRQGLFEVPDAALGVAA